MIEEITILNCDKGHPVQVGWNTQLKVFVFFCDKCGEGVIRCALDKDTEIQIMTIVKRPPQ